MSIWLPLAVCWTSLIIVTALSAWFHDLSTKEFDCFGDIDKQVEEAEKISAKMGCLSIKISALCAIALGSGAWLMVAIVYNIVELIVSLF